MIHLKDLMLLALVHVLMLMLHRNSQSRVRVHFARHENSEQRRRCLGRPMWDTGSPENEEQI